LEFEKKSFLIIANGVSGCLKKTWRAKICFSPLPEFMAIWDSGVGEKIAFFFFKNGRSRFDVDWCRCSLLLYLLVRVWLGDA
jgi:hypothetical protein